MDYETLGNVVLLAIVTLISVVQNGKGIPSLRVEFVSSCLKVRLTQLCVCVYAFVFMCICIFI